VLGAGVPGHLRLPLCGSNTCACAGCVLLANAAYIQASLLWITLTPIIYKFNRYCKLRFGEARAPRRPAARRCAPAA